MEESKIETTINEGDDSQMADEDQNFQIIGQTSVIDAELTGLFAENLAAKLQGNPSSTVMGLVKRL